MSEDKKGGISFSPATLGIVCAGVSGLLGWSFVKSAGVLWATDTTSKNLNVVITGGSRGLGQALAREFLKYGDRVVRHCSG